ncbi:MAG: ATP-binding protein [Clostridia bacterium]|nr:ATP-binding protein [Clostridia bacterium]
MSNSTLNNLLKDYEKKKYTAELNYEKDKSAFYTSHPELSEINDKLGKLALDISKAVLKMDSELADNLKKEFYKLKKKKEDILKSSDVPQNVKEPNYECSICKDTGFIIDITGKNSLCNCIRQKMFDIDFNKSNIGNLEKENFENFNFDLYSDEINEQKYRAKISPKQNIANIKNIAVKFVENFDNPEEKNLLFTGNTGLGKTFFSNCIAKEMLSKGKTVLYQTAPIMLDNIIDDRFGKSDYTAVYKNIINVDLLIIDDLGAEVSNQYKIAELFNIINARLLTPNGRITKTIISTNLSMQNIMDTYQERIFSRLASYYNICRFFRR